MHIYISKETVKPTKFQINLVDVGGVAGTMFRTDGRTGEKVDEQTHTPMDESYFYSPPSRMSGDNKVRGESEKKERTSLAGS